MLGAVSDDAARLGREKYVSLSTYRKDGRQVPTPVWVVEHQGRLRVWTPAGSGKVKRLRNRRDVLVAPCTRRGTVTGPAVPGTATILPASATGPVSDAVAAKYGVTSQLYVRLVRLVRLLRSERLVLEIEV